MTKPKTATEIESSQYKSVHAHGLTPREREAVTWASEGKSAETIGTIITCSARTAKAHLENAARKLNVENRYALIAKVWELGIVTAKQAPRTLALALVGFLSLKAGLNPVNEALRPSRVTSTVRVTHKSRARRDDILSNALPGLASLEEIDHRIETLEQIHDTALLEWNVDMTLASQDLINLFKEKRKQASGLFEAMRDQPLYQSA